MGACCRRFRQPFPPPLSFSQVTAPVQIAYAPVDIDLNPDEDAEGKPIDSGDASPGSDIPPPPGRRLLAGCAAGEKFTISPDPLDLSNACPADFRNWASLLSQVGEEREGREEERAQEKKIKSNRAPPSLSSI